MLSTSTSSTFTSASKLSLALALFWLSSIAVPAAGVNTFIGCYNNAASNSVLISADNVPVGFSLPDSSTSCTQVCEAYGVHYSIGGPDVCLNNRRYHTRMIGTSMTFVDQYTTATFADPNEVYAIVDTAQECFQHCVDSPQASFRVDRTASPQVMRCYCSAITSAGASTTTSSGFYLFTHEAGAYGNQASNFVKRQMRERLQIARNRALRAVCPNELTACKVSAGDEYSFECIDTQSELESCGGCTYGEYNNATAPLGQDCNTIGTAFGASTCLNGRCVSFACRRGYTLVDGACVLR
ncbi:hypothetical protein IAU59_004992 [Kwoniella sp. CBS 9459]